MELPAAAVDVARPLDCAVTARRGVAARRDRAGRSDAKRGRRRDVVRPPFGSAARRPLAGVASARAWPRVRGRRRRGRLEPRRRRDVATRRRGTRSPLHLGRRRRSRRPRPLVRLGEHRAVRGARSPECGGVPVPVGGRRAVDGARGPRRTARVDAICAGLRRRAAVLGLRRRDGLRERRPRGGLAAAGARAAGPVRSRCSPRRSSCR
jgi:hypothetical protein